MHYSNLRHLILPSTTCAPLLNTWASQTNELAAIYFSTELLFLSRTPHEHLYGSRKIITQSLCIILYSTGMPHI